MNALKLGYAYSGHILLWLFVLRAMLAPFIPAWFMQAPVEKMLWLGLLLLPALAISYFSLGMFSQLSALFALLLGAGLWQFVRASPPPSHSPWLLLVVVVALGCLVLVC